MLGRPRQLGLWVSALLLCAAASARADEPPEWLPHYNLDVVLDTRRLLVRFTEEVTWTNISDRPIDQIVFNAHAAYKIPSKDIGLLAKMLEILRVSPREGLPDGDPALTVDGAGVHKLNGKALHEDRGPAHDGVSVPFSYARDNQTALIIPLPEPLQPGQKTTIRLNCSMKLPPKKGRWGQWDGITTLAQWLPVVAVHDGTRFTPAPFVPWHQPFYNEAGLYTVRVTLPADQKLAASSTERTVRDLPDGWRAIDFHPAYLRDFALIACARFEEEWGEADGVKVRCLHLPEHEFYGKVITQAVCDAIPVYNQWFGRYPYPQFTVVEASFGWNGNECGGLVMIDDRMFRMPHLAKVYPAYLVQHELCHQWFYNVIGTNGYAETFMDEGPATYFSHRLCDRLVSRNNAMLDYPKGFDWAPNIHREELRNFSYLGARARGDILPTVQDMEKYGHLVNLSAVAYDRGSKIIGQIEQRLGPDFFPFLRQLYRKYQFRILLVKNLQAELEAYTGQSWEEFFQYWVYGSGMCDWAVGNVEVTEEPSAVSDQRSAVGPRLASFTPSPPHPLTPSPYKVVVRLKQRTGFNEPTTLGIRFAGETGYQIRIPIEPNLPLLQGDEPVPWRVECVTRVDKRQGQQADVRVELLLPTAPSQITVDPDKLLLDDCPTNNHWQVECGWRLTPAYTQLEETDMTNAYDRWNFIAGPWMFAASYNDPWFVRTAEAGFRVGVYRTQNFSGGVYLGYRSDDRNTVVGADGVWDHVLLPHAQIGYTFEQSIATLGPQDIRNTRGVVYSRYIFMYGDSMYLQPFNYIETFGMYSNRGLPNPYTTLPGANPFNDRPAVGAHYHLNLLTPYWDAEGGLLLDVSYQYGLPIVGNSQSFQEVYGQVSWVKSMPQILNGLRAVGLGPAVAWFNDTRWAFRIGGATSLPSNGEMFTLGGGNLFRGYGLDQRQGNSIVVGSIEWRVPVIQNVDYDFCDHVAGLRNAYIVPFYDVGDAFLEHQQLGTVAHALGVGLRLDTTWLGMIERSMLRIDVAKTINDSSGWQVWLGFSHPF